MLLYEKKGKTRKWMMITGVCRNTVICGKNIKDRFPAGLFPVYIKTHTLLKSESDTAPDFFTLLFGPEGCGPG